MRSGKETSLKYQRSNSSLVTNDKFLLNTLVLYSTLQLKNNKRRLFKLLSKNKLFNDNNS